MQVLNGNVEVGDTVAVAISDATHRAGMRIGVLKEIIPTKRYGLDSFSCKIEVHESGGWEKTPYVRVFPHPERMVRL